MYGGGRRCYFRVDFVHGRSRTSYGELRVAWERRRQGFRAAMSGGERRRYFRAGFVHGGSRTFYGEVGVAWERRR
jgi:hypothetical protein